MNNSAVRYLTLEEVLYIHANQIDEYGGSHGIRDDSFNQGNINTIVSIAITSNLNLSQAPDNVLISSKDSNLSKDSVINVSQIVTLDKERFLNKAGKLKSNKLDEVEVRLKLATGLD